MRKILIFCITLTFSLNAESTYVPNDNFEQKLIDLGHDDVLDNYVLTENVSALTDLDVNSSSIADLTGIEAFTALTLLFAYNN